MHYNSATKWCPQAKRVMEETEAEQAREREEASKADREKFEKVFFHQFSMNIHALKCHEKGTFKG